MPLRYSWADDHQMSTLGAAADEPASVATEQRARVECRSGGVPPIRSVVREKAPSDRGRAEYTRRPMNSDRAAGRGERRSPEAAERAAAASGLALPPVVGDDKPKIFFISDSPDRITSDRNVVRRINSFSRFTVQPVSGLETPPLAAATDPVPRVRAHTLPGSIPGSAAGSRAGSKPSSRAGSKPGSKENITVPDAVSPRLRRPASDIPTGSAGRKASTAGRPGSEDGLLHGLQRPLLAVPTILRRASASQLHDMERGGAAGMPRRRSFNQWLHSHMHHHNHHG
ncbi:hypothetical protein FJT64_017834 [Amphibalanus amphitrite]|uniref:Uncharacterized protein n=1 Tax=Amphibalanus amphitrite TaxID=1232801 RepID=A0A6A4X5I1_AMPAM|nr:hypothetical protein FJT64_017834 [Amphibalanus amphitrite]